MRPKNIVDNDNEQHDTLNVTRASAEHDAIKDHTGKKESEREKNEPFMHHTLNRFAAPTALTRSSKTKVDDKKKLQIKKQKYAAITTTTGNKASNGKQAMIKRQEVLPENKLH